MGQGPPDRSSGLDPGILRAAGARPGAHALEPRADLGQQAADHFLACYQAITSTPLSDQPYWDLIALLDLLLDTGDPAGPGDTDPGDLRGFENYAKGP